MIESLPDDDDDDDQEIHQEEGNQRVQSQEKMEACYEDDYEKGEGFQSRRNPWLCDDSNVVVVECKERAFYRQWYFTWLKNDI